MDTVLVTYGTMSGSTAEVARAVSEEVANKGLQVKLLPLEKVADLSGYRAVVLGAPMAMGWHPSARKFLVNHREAIQRIPLAIFATALNLTWIGETDINGVPVCVDARLGKPMQKPGRPSLKERHTSIQNYAAPMIKAALPARPVSVAFFGGMLDYKRLKLPAMLFVRLVIQAQPGDRRNWEAIRSWASGLPVM